MKFVHLLLFTLILKSFCAQAQTVVNSKDSITITLINEATNEKLTEKKGKYKINKDKYKDLTTNQAGEIKIHLSVNDSITISVSGYKEKGTKLAERFFRDKAITFRLEAKTDKPESSPLRIITADELTRFGYVNLGQALHYVLPSFYSVPQTIADGTDHTDPATLKGLGPDQVLILVNGKRRHTSSLIHANGTIGRGTVGTDLNAIPLSAIEKIEILEDGASVLYGSDAIAGVIDIKLKQDFKQQNAQVTWQYGTTDAGDGAAHIIRGYVGQSSDKDFISGSFAYTDWGAINRSGVYTGNVYTTDSIIDPRRIVQDSFFDKTGYDRNRIMQVGKADTRDIGGTLNLDYDFSEKLGIYAFGTLNKREGEAAGFYRLPIQTSKVVADSFPNGFSPRITSDIIDLSANGGLIWKPKGENNLAIDISSGYGQNTFGFGVQNSNNASTGKAWVGSAERNAGKTIFGQFNGNIDMRDWSIGDFFTVGAGASYRRERYAIEAGDSVTYAVGNNTNNEPFAQVFPGFRGIDALKATRQNLGFYFDVKLTPFVNASESLLKNLLVEGTYRFEEYRKMILKKASIVDNVETNGTERGDYNAEHVFRIGIKTEFLEPGTNIQKITPRASFNTGFRAPSLHQYWYRKINVQGINQDLIRIANFDNFNPIVTNGFGIDPLQAETSKNYNVGFEMLIGKDEASSLKLSADYFYLVIKDRIILSGIFRADADPAFAKNLSDSGAEAAQFFTNAIDKTISRGGNVNLSKKFPLSSGNLDVNASLFFATHRVGNINAENINASSTTDKESILFNREEVSRLEVAQPNSQFTVAAVYNIDNWHFSLRTTRFGQVQYVDPTNPLQDQIFSPKWVTDLNISAPIGRCGKVPLFEVSLGVNNLFDVYPDTHINPANIDEGRFIYSRRVQQFGVGGRFAYAQLNLNLDWDKNN